MAAHPTGHQVCQREPDHWLFVISSTELTLLHGILRSDAEIRPDKRRAQDTMFISALCHTNFAIHN